MTVLHRRRFPDSSSPEVADCLGGGAPRRRLPQGCSVRRAAAGDCRHIAGLLRDADRDEMEALEGRPAEDVLRGWMAQGARTLLWQGQAAALYGVVSCEGDVAGARLVTPWAAMVSTLSLDELIDTLWLSRFQIDAWQRRWPLLQTVCDARNVFRSDWLEWLGFQRRGRVERFGRAGLPFDLHVRTDATADR